jgi:hypothetical protein
MSNITAEKIDEINGIINEMLKKYGLGMKLYIVSENLLEIKIIPIIVRKPRKRIATVKRAKAVRIEVKRIVDENPDLSFLETTPEHHYGKNGSNWDHVSEEDIQRVINQYGSIWNACIAYAKQDKERLDTYNRGVWEMIGIRAVATIHIPVDGDTVKIQTIDSGGLFGIESDSDNNYIQDIGREQITEVKNHLRILCTDGIDDCEIITE